MIKAYIKLAFNLIVLSTGIWVGWEGRAAYEANPVVKLVRGVQ